MGDTRADVAAMDELELLGVLASWLSGRPPDVPEGLPWGAMLALAERHGVLVLLHRAARASCWQRLGSEVREALLRGAGRAAAGAMLGDHHLSATLALLARQGIRPLVMKGAALAQTHYGDGALRPRCDVDLLVAPEDREPVDELLTAAGFRRLNSVRGEHISHQSTYVQEQPQGFPHAYDIHWRPSNRNLFAGVQSYGELLGRSVPLPGLGPAARTLAPADALMLACVHRLSHRAGGLRLIWAYDIHLLVQGLDAQELADFVERACSRGVVRVCQEAILEARHWLGTERPGLAEWLATPAAAPEPTAGALRPQGRIAGLIGELRALPTLRARARLIQEHLLPPADYLLERYRTRRRWLLPALYGWRLVRGLARAAMAPAPRAHRHQDLAQSVWTSRDETYCRSRAKVPRGHG